MEAMPKEGTPEWDQLRRETRDKVQSQRVAAWRVYTAPTRQQLVQPIRMSWEGDGPGPSIEDATPLLADWPTQLIPAEPGLFLYSVQLADREQLLGMERAEHTSFTSGEKFVKQAMPFVWQDKSVAPGT